MVTLKLNASMGSAAWNGAETGEELMARADALAYTTKEACSARENACTA